MVNVFDNLDGIVNFDSVSVYSPNSIALVEVSPITFANYDLTQSTCS